jgi:hypothetical protein
MALAFSVNSPNGRAVIGNLVKISGTFTGVRGDSSGSLTAATHGLNFIADYSLKFDGAIAAQNPLVSIASGTLTITFDDLPQAVTGTWIVEGR